MQSAILQLAFGVLLCGALSVHSSPIRGSNFEDMERLGSFGSSQGPRLVRSPEENETSIPPHNQNHTMEVGAANVSPAVSASPGNTGVVAVPINPANPPAQVHASDTGMSHGVFMEQLHPKIFNL